MVPALYKHDQHIHLQLSGELEGFLPIPPQRWRLNHDPASLLAVRLDQHTPALSVLHVLVRLSYPLVINH